MTKYRFDLTNIFTQTVLQWGSGQPRKTKQRTSNGHCKTTLKS